MVKACGTRRARACASWSFRRSTGPWWFLTLTALGMVAIALGRLSVPHPPVDSRQSGAAGILAPADRVAGRRAQAHRRRAPRQPGAAAHHHQEHGPVVPERAGIAPARRAQQIEEISTEASQAIGEVKEICLQPPSVSVGPHRPHEGGRGDRPDRRRRLPRSPSRSRSTTSTMSFPRTPRSTSTGSCRRA